MIIAFIGCDGSGKSTLANVLIKKIKEKGLDVEYKHQYDYFISKTLGAPIRKKKNINRKTKRKRFYYKLWIFVVYPNLLLNWFWRKIAKKDEVFISDRYVYDLMIGWDLQGRLNFVSRFLLENFPKPDVLFLTDAKPKTLYKRRGDEYPSMKFCKRKRKLYLDFANKNKIKVISTEKGIDESKKEIIEYVNNRGKI